MGGTKELLLFSPEQSDDLRPGYGTCDADSSPFDPLSDDDISGPVSYTSPTLTLQLSAGDALIIPRAWWYWCRAVTPCVTLRRCFVEQRILPEVAPLQESRKQQIMHASQASIVTVRAIRDHLRLHSGSFDDGLALLKLGTGPAALQGQYVSFHWVVYAED